jgi:hypothetical protein
MIGAGRAIPVLVALALVLAATATPGAAGAAPRSGGLSISIVLPVNGSEVKGDVNITGNASGPDGVALSVQLSIDGGPWYAAEGNLSWTWLWSTFAFGDGPRTVRARVTGGGEESADAATYLVRNRKATFALRDVFPPGDGLRLRPGETAGFFVRVETSYIGSFVVGWFLDGEQVRSGGAEWYNHTAREGETGNHTVEVRVIADGAVEASRSWNLSVRPWAIPPVVRGFSPAGKDLATYRGYEVRFNVTALDLQDRGLTYHWRYDFAPAPGNATGSSAVLLFNSTGAHVVEVEVSNGETNTTVRWNVTVEEAPAIGLFDVLPCTLYIVIGLFLGLWYGRRTSLRRAV